MKKFLQIHDQHSKIFGHRILNSQLTLYLGIVQLFVCWWAFSQHIYSFIVFDEILHCDFENSTDATMLTAVDAIIFDVGLFHSLWGIHGCVAQHLDGGYGRFGWCICHIGALLFCLPFAFVSRPKPFYLWPLLIQQSAYGIGLLILSLAALPRILPTFMGDLENAPLSSIVVYVFGICMNFFLLLILWHWYWHVESMWDSARKVRTDQLERMSANRKQRHSPASSKKYSIDAQTTKIVSNGSTVVRKDGAMSNGIMPKKMNGDLMASMLPTKNPLPMPNHSPSNLSQSSRVSSLAEKNSIRQEVTTLIPNYSRRGTQELQVYTPMKQAIDVYQNSYSSDDEAEAEYLDTYPINLSQNISRPTPLASEYSKKPLYANCNGYKPVNGPISNGRIVNGTNFCPQVAKPQPNQHMRLSSVYSLMQSTVGKPPQYYIPQPSLHRNYMSLQDSSPRTDL